MMYIGDSASSSTPFNTTPKEKLLYSRREAAELLSISVRMVDYWIAREELYPVRRIGGRVLIPLETLMDFAQRDHVVVQ